MRTRLRTAKLLPDAHSLGCFPTGLRLNGVYGIGEESYEVSGPGEFV